MGKKAANKIITGLKEAVRNARRAQTTGCEMDVRVWVPPGVRVTIDRVIGLDADGNLVQLEVLGAFIKPKD